MNPRHLTFIVLLVLALCLPAAAGAQEAIPPTAVSSGDRSPEPVAAPNWEDAGPAMHASPSTWPVQPSTVAAPDIAIGQPGLSFRYVRTFGETERAYFDDTAHLNYPYGLTTDGNNVWIADSNGLRAVKYTSDGTFVSQIGKAGFRYGTGQSLEYVADVGVDSAGNIWLVDSDVSHVLKFDASGKYLSKLGRSYDSGPSNDRFHGPHSIAFDSAGNIYVSDSWNNRIQVFKADSSYLATIGITGVEGSDNAHFCNPQHIAITSNVLYIADACNHRVQLFNVANPQAASYLATIGVSGQSGSDNAHFDHPLGVTVDATRIYVADENNHRVQVFDRTTRAYQATISDGWGQDNDHLRHPSDVAVDAAGNLYVADWLNARVQQFNSSLAYVRTFGTTAVPYLTDNLHYNKPSGVAVAPDGSIYVTEERGQRLLKLAANGAAQWTVGRPGVIVDADGNDRFNYPRDVALASSGQVYVADAGNNRVQIFNTDGSYYATLGTGWGSGNNQFKWPAGLFIASDGTIYVADDGNHRVQIYNGSRAYVATIGVTGVDGSDNAHFRYPQDVVVDSRGTIYVADGSNYRVQVFDANRDYVRTIGVTGEGGDGFDRLNGPDHLAVDARDNLYVSSAWNHDVHVYDQNGAYLTTIGGSRGNRTGQLADPHGLAFDAAGNLYIADYNNHRIQKFAAGVPGWRQVNINGFGDRNNGNILTLAPFGDQLYAGTSNYRGQGSQLWRMSTAGDWTPVMRNGFGDSNNIGIDHLAEFDGKLYAGIWNQNLSTGATAGAQVWRSSNGTDWSQVVTAGFGDPTNGEAFHLAPFKGQLYAATWSYTPAHGAEIWRSNTGNSGDWMRVVANGFGDANNAGVMTLERFDDHLYAGTYNWNSTAMTSTGGTVWRTSDGVNWTQVNTPGFGSVRLNMISALAAFNGYLYAGTTGPYMVWRCQACDGSDWQKVQIKSVAGTAGGPSGLHVSGNQLYLSSGDTTTGMEVWRTADGIGWEQVGFAGFGNSNNRYTYYDNAMATLNNRLYIGTQNSTNGGQVWMKTLTADFTATPTRGAPPLTVQFTNTSAGDFTLSQWDFGDGSWSEATNPAHLYAAAGMYTVTLRVSAGMEASTVTKAAYIDVHRRVFLPLVMRNWDPLLYDDFNDPAWDGAWNPAKWTPDQTSTSYRQQGGALVVTEPSSANPTGGTLRAMSPQFRSWKRTQLVEARLKMSSDRTGGWSPIGITLIDDAVNGHGWFAACRLGASGGSSQASFGCSIFIRQGNNYPQEYATEGFPVDYNAWCTARIETDPTTGNVKFYLNNVLIGSHLPNDAAALVTSNQMAVAITNWGGDANSSATRYVDDVRITPAR